MADNNVTQWTDTSRVETADLQRWEDGVNKAYCLEEQIPEMIAAHNTADGTHEDIRALANEKANSLVFDTKDHLMSWLNKNLCPLPVEEESSIWGITVLNDDGTFNYTHNSGNGTGSIPVHFTLPAGTYTISTNIKSVRPNDGIKVFVGLDTDHKLDDTYTFSITESTYVTVYISSEEDLAYTDFSVNNVRIQVETGSTATEFVPYTTTYIREDGVIKDDLKVGDLLLIEQSGVPDYWWDGSVAVEMEAQQKVDQTYAPTSEDAQSGIAIDKYVTDNFSDIIIETSHSVNSPAEVDCCLKGQNIVGGNILGAEPIITDNGVAQSFLGDKLYLPQNLIMHFTPINPIKNRTFTGNNITLEEGTAFHYKFTADYYAAGFNEKTTQLEIGQEYMMRMDATCTDENNPSKWGFGVFSAQQYSSAYNVSSKTLITVKEIGTDSIVYQRNTQPISYTDFSSQSPAIMKYGNRYIIELVFTSSYSGEVYFGMRSEGAPITVDLMSCLFCKTESLPMLVDRKINTNLMRIGSISDSIDLATGQKTKNIMIEALSFAKKQYATTYGKALPSVPIYLISGTLDNPDWVRKVSPSSGTNDYYFHGLTSGYIVYATRTPVTEQVDIDIPVVCTDEFEVYTSSEDNMVPYFQTSVDTKKSANKYLKKISNTIISMGGNI